MRFIITVLISFSVSFIVIHLCNAVSYLRRIAEALEDYVYDDEDEEESEVAK